MSKDSPVESVDQFSTGPFKILVRLELSQYLDPVGLERLTVEIDIKTDWTEQKVLRITLNGVQGTSLRVPQRNGVRVYLVIDSIRDRQWDGLNYMLESRERDAEEEISILCESFTVRTIEQ